MNYKVIKSISWSCQNWAKKHSRLHERSYTNQTFYGEHNPDEIVQLDQIPTGLNAIFLLDRNLSFDLMGLFNLVGKFFDVMGMFWTFNLMNMWLHY